MAKREPREFWTMTDSGADNQGKDAVRFELELQMSLEQQWELQSGKRLDWKEPIRAIAARDDFREDVPWTDLSLVVVSDRLRLLMEELAPDDCQFLPLAIFCRDKHISDNYWLLNALHMIDCIDREASAEFEFPNKPVLYWKVVIDAARVPPLRHIFRIKGHSYYLCVRKKIKTTMERAEITGFHFMPP